MRTHLQLFVILILTFALFGCNSQKDKPIPSSGIQEVTHNLITNQRRITFLSDVYEVKDIYRSMMGPYTKSEINLTDGEEAELLWITGYSAIMVEPDGETPMSQEYMCHSNLDIDSKTRRMVFRNKLNPIMERLFTISQGQYDIQFPDGFGIPVTSAETLSLTTQVLNLNTESPDIKTRHKVTIDYIKDSELISEMKPLLFITASGMKRLNEDYEGYFSVNDPDNEIHGEGCLVGESVNANSHILEDKFSRPFTGHWVVKPGKEVNHTLITETLKIPYNTTAHYIAVHLHPFAESLELKDLTTGETVFKSSARNSKDKIGLDYVDYFSSSEGIAIYKDHEYQLISSYNNTTDTDQDSMAVIYMYVLDREYKKPNLAIAEFLIMKPSNLKSGDDL